MGSIASDIAAGQGKPLDILTERQRMAYSLRLEEKTYGQIAEEMGITANAVPQLIHYSLRRFREYERYSNAKMRNNEPVDFPITRGELVLTRRGLELLVLEFEKEAPSVWRGVDWLGRMPYEYERTKELIARVRSILYGGQNGSKDASGEYKAQDP